MQLLRIYIKMYWTVVLKMKTKTLSKPTKILETSDAVTMYVHIQ